MPSSTTINSITIQSGGTVNGGTGTTLTIAGAAGAWNNMGTFNAGTSTIVFTNAAATMADPTSFYNVTVADGASLTLGTGNYIGISGTLSLSTTGILNAGTNENTVEYNGSGSQTVVNPNGAVVGYHNLVLSNTGTLNFASSTELYIRGNFINNSTTTSVPEYVEFNGPQNMIQNIGGTTSTAFQNLEINNTYGVALTGSNISVSGNLLFTSGTLTTGSAKITLTSVATATGAGAGKYIIGNLEKYFPNASDPSFTFDIGDLNEYSPVTINFNGATTGSGSLLVYYTDDEHPQLNTSGLDTARSVDHYWTIVNNGISGFTSYSATFNFTNFDMDVAADPDYFVVQEYNGSIWNGTTTGTRTSTSTKATGLTSFGDFVVGDADSLNVTTQPVNSAICNGSNTSFTAASTSIPAPTVHWERFNGSIWEAITSSLDAGTTYSNYTTGTLSLTGSTLSLNGYQYRAVFTNINGSVNSDAVTLTVNAIPTISVSSNPSICFSATSANFSYSSITGSPDKYSITYDATAILNGFSNLTNENLPASPIGLSVPANIASSVYNDTLTVTNSSTGCSSSKYNLTITVNNNTSISADPSGYSVCAGGSATDLSVSASGTGTLHYQWYSNTSNSNSGGTTVGTDAASFTPDVSTAGTYYFYVTVSGDCSSATSAVATVVVNANTSISSDPSGYSVCAGGSATDLSVSASGTGTLHYQWYSNTSNSNSGGSAVGTDAASYTPDVSTAGTYYFYVTVSGDCSSATSAVATVVVNANTSISADPSGYSVCAGGSATDLSVSASGTGTLHYQWYSNTSNSNSGGSAVGTDAASYTPDVSTAGTYYFYVTVSGDCSSATSAVATVVVNANTSISADPSGYSVCTGGSATDLSVSASGTGTLHYQWYSNTSNSNSGGSAVGTDAASYTPDVSTAGTYYFYVTVSGDCSSATSAVATVVVNANTSISC